MGQNHEQVVRDVLLGMSHIREAALIEGVDYPEHLTLKLLDHFRLHRVVAGKVITLGPEVSVWLPGLSLGQVMSIHAGVPCDVVSAVAVALLVQGRRVHVLADTVEMRTLSLARNSYAKRFKDAYKVLLGVGLTVHEDIMSAHSSVDWKGRVFLEDDARKWLKSGRKKIVLSKATIVTPLAQDYARHNNLTIERL